MIITSIPTEGYINTGVPCPCCEQDLYAPGDVEPDIDLIVGELCRECEQERDRQEAEQDWAEEMAQALADPCPAAACDVCPHVSACPVSYGFPA